MKSLISRESYRPEKRYSGVYHVQGCMVTDADLDERSRITQDQTDNLGVDTIKDGVPSVGGAVAIGVDDMPSLQEGVIYADGVRGVLTTTEGADLSSPLALFSNQADFPESPSLLNAEQIIYADIWERPVYPLEDEYLADIGLHGAVTAFRTRTMTQLKTAPFKVFGEIETGTGRFPKIGTAKLTVPPFDAGAFTDNCDPCAGTVTLEQAVANALWRLEVIDVTGTPKAPEKITLAWSIENAAAIAKEDVPDDDFERTNKVYEFFSETTESHLGVMADANDAIRSVFVDDMSGMPSPAVDLDGRHPLPYVRRWDGQAVVIIDASGNVPDGDSLGGGFTISINSKIITLNVGDFTVELNLDGAAVVAGDYWLVELRRHAPETEKVLAVQALPFGVIHHYCTLFRVNKSGEIMPLTNEEVRKLSFPVLSDLPATHVDFDNNCEKLYADSENVQEALDNLCDISADDIAFKPNCTELYDNAQNVQDALDSLCKIDFSVHDSFQSLFDWGVLCGIVPSLLETGDIKISIGSFLDRSGRITNVIDERVLSTNVIDERVLSTPELKKNRIQILFDSFGKGRVEDLNDALEEGKACLALAAEEGGDASAYLVHKDFAFGPDDPGYRMSVENCLNEKTFIDLDDLVDNLSPVKQAVIKKMMIVSSVDNAFRGSAKLTNAEAKDAHKLNQLLGKKFRDVASAAEVKIFKDRILQVEQENPIGNTRDAAQQVRQMQQETAVFGVFLESEEERKRRCICQALFPTCPPKLGDAPYLVPIACLSGKYENKNGSFHLHLDKVCPFSCRKQAMTWRSLQYFISEGRNKIATMFGQLCCGREKVNGGGFTIPDRIRNFDAVELVEKYKMMEVFTGRPPKSPTDYKTKILVNDLSEADAIRTLKGNGIEIAETIDVNDENAFTIIEEKSVGISTIDQLIAAESVRPGDKVGLLVQKGVARGYVLLEKGSGKLPFPTKTAAFSIAVSKEDELKAKELINATNTAKRELKELVTLRETLSADVIGLKADVEMLGTEREKSVVAVKEVETQLSALANTRIEITREIKAINAELASVEKNRKEIVTAVREAQPVTVVIGNDDQTLINKLAGAGVTSVADISNLSATKIKKLEQAGIIKAATANTLKQKATTFLARRIR